MPRPYYAIQPAFTGGEISADVASRVDLDKYQLALLKAENTIIKPYGSIRKRPGLKYLGTTKNNGQVILRRFEYSADLSYLLEIGVGYIRIWKNGSYLGVEVATPFDATDLKNFRSIQSVDVMYICTGRHPVHKLMRFAENIWQLVEMSWIIPPMGDPNDNPAMKVAASATTGNITMASTGDLFNSSHVGCYIKIHHYVKDEARTLGFPSGDNVFGNYRTSSSWKIQTAQRWGGTVWIEMSTDDGATWRRIREYRSGGTDVDQANYTESGTVEELCFLRVGAHIDNGASIVTFTTMGYNVTGYARITNVGDARNVAATVLSDKPLGDTYATSDFALSAFSSANGYPYTVTFFQDRLCFGGCPKYPQRIWMSRSGDYENFEVEKEKGTITDDSCVTTNLLSLKSYKINHLYAQNDLFVLTEGNTWSISGGETVTPTRITPRNQENYGSNHVEPIKVGTRMVYVQRNGSTIRDVGYSYDSDAYVGMDITLLAKHLVQGKTVEDVAYTSQPESNLYFIRNDGVILCLTYEPTQKVYAWSHIVTDGKAEAVAAITQGNSDKIYVVVNRIIGGQTKRYMEVFDNESTSNAQQDYHMLDSYVEKNGTKSAVISGLGHLEGKVVKVLADNYYYDDKTYTVQSGQITLPEAVTRAVVGLPYTMIIEQPNFDAGNTDTGTLQGRPKSVTTAILRLVRSYGGSIGPNASAQNKIIYDPNKMELGENLLFTGDKEVVLGTGGYNNDGRTYIIQDEPYPFSLSAIIREVSV